MKNPPSPRTIFLRRAPTRFASATSSAGGAVPGVALSSGLSQSMRSYSKIRAGAGAGFVSGMLGPLSRIACADDGSPAGRSRNGRGPPGSDSVPGVFQPIGHVDGRVRESLRAFLGQQLVEAFGVRRKRSGVA